MIFSYIKNADATRRPGKAAATKESACTAHDVDECRNDGRREGRARMFNSAMLMMQDACLRLKRCGQRSISFLRKRATLARRPGRPPLPGGRRFSIAADSLVARYRHEDEARVAMRAASKAHADDTIIDDDSQEPPAPTFSLAAHARGPDHRIAFSARHENASAAAPRRTR